MARARGRLENGLREQFDRLRRHRSADYGSFGGAWWDELERKLRSLTPRASAAADFRAAQRLEADLHSITRQISEAAAEARAEQEAERLRREMEQKRAEREIALSVLRSGLEGLDADLSHKFDAARFNAINQSMDTIRRMIDAGDFARAERETGAARAKLAQHSRRVEEAHQAWLAARQEAQEATASLEARLPGLRADPVVMAWCEAEVNQLGDLLQAWSEWFERERFDDIRRAVPDVEPRVEALLNKAEAAQLQEEKRAFIVNGFLQVLGHEGFFVGEPELQQPNDFGSPVIIRAVRTDGRKLDIAVPHSGQVTYEVGGYPRRTEIGTDSAPHPSCDEAEEQLLKMHQTLSAEFGLDMGEVTWDGKDPGRIRRGSKELPGGGAHQSRIS